MWNREFWKDLGERAVSTFVQAFLGSLVAAIPAAVGGVPTHDVALGVLVTAVVAGLAASLKAVYKQFKSVSSDEDDEFDEVDEPIDVEEDPEGF